MKSKYEYIAIEGNIGAGKTTLSTILAERWKAKLILEQFSENPFLPKFYQDPKRHAFSLELSFMAERYRQLKEEVESRDLFQPQIVADYLFYKCRIFSLVNLDEDELTLYDTLFEILYANLPKPDIILYLHWPVTHLLENIAKRGRSYEQQIEAAYLERIAQSYFDYFKSHLPCPVLILYAPAFDYLKNPDQIETIETLLEKAYDKKVYHLGFE